MSTPPPQTISWNLTRLCNLSCGHCYLDAVTRKGEARDELDTAACLEVAANLHAVNPEALLILTGGEPLLRKDLDKIVAAATAKGLWVVVGTNGTLLNPNRATMLKAAGVKGVGISIDSLTPGKHDGFRGRHGAWKGAVAGVKAAVAAGIDTVIQVSVNPWMVGEIPALVDLSLELGARAVNFYFLVCTGRGQEQTQLTSQRAEDVYAELFRLQKEHTGRLLVNAKCAPQYQRFIHRKDPHSTHLHTFQGGCPAATHYCRIDPKGEVTPCPYIPISGGNLLRTPFEEIWRDAEPFRRLRDREGLQGRCGACEYRSLCGGCRARALAGGGGLMDEDPFCTYVPGEVSVEPVSLPDTALYGATARPAGESAWEREALDSLGKIPPFIRSMVKRRMEAYAIKRGMGSISMEIMAEMRDKAKSIMGGSLPK
ncbi:MAG: radical SAM protein [bacterium]